MNQKAIKETRKTMTCLGFCWSVNSGWIQLRKQAPEKLQPDSENVSTCAVWKITITRNTYKAIPKTAHFWWKNNVSELLSKSKTINRYLLFRIHCCDGVLLLEMLWDDLVTFIAQFFTTKVAKIEKLEYKLHKFGMSTIQNGTSTMTDVT